MKTLNGKSLVQYRTKIIRIKTYFSFKKCENGVHIYSLVPKRKKHSSLLTTKTTSTQLIKSSMHHNQQNIGTKTYHNKLNIHLQNKNNKEINTQFYNRNR